MVCCSAGTGMHPHLSSDFMKLSVFRPYEDDRFFALLRDRIASIVERRIGKDNADPVVQVVMIRLRAEFSKQNARDNFFSTAFEMLNNRIEEHRNRNELDTDWNEILEKSLQVLQSENPESAALIVAIMNGANFEELQRRTGAGRDDLIKMLDRCRSSLMRTISEMPGVALP